MKTRARTRGPNGQFQKNLNGDGKLVFWHVAQLVVAAAVTMAVALLLVRCHIVWTGGGDVVMPLGVTPPLG